MYNRLFRSGGYEPTIAGHAPVSRRGSGNYGNHGDVVLDDHEDDGETFLGDGKAGLMGKSSAPPTTTLYMGTTVPTGGRNVKSTRNRGVHSGPISSNLDDHDKRRMNRMKNGPNSRNSPLPADRPLSLNDPAPVSSTLANRGLSLDKTAPKSTVFFLTGSKTDSSQSKTLADNMTGKPSEPTKKSSVTDSKRLEDMLSADASSRLGNRNMTPKKDAESGEHGFSDSSNAPKTQPTDLISVRKAENARYKDMLTGAKPAKHKPKASKLDDLELGDIDDLDEEVNKLDIGPRIPIRQPTFVVDSKPIDIKTAIDLKTLVLGSAQQVFNAEWKYQSFTFCDLPRLQFGFVQKKGGPCGVLASVQACFLKDLLFKDNKKPTVKDLEPSRNIRSEVLAETLATILWRCGDGLTASVTVPSRKTHFPSSSRIKADGLIETLMVHTLSSREDLQTFLYQNIGQFELDGSSGVICALYSAVLTRTISRVRSDMDEPNGTLMGAHGYCTQDMVNLLLTGRASSNVFNDDVELDGGNGHITILQGVKGRNDVGLLSLFEHYKSCQVGCYLKTPIYPIWVICSESHFSVLFCLRRELLRDWKAEKRFDLYYFDGLGKQDEEIRLSIDTTNRFFEAPSDDELVPPLELCIRTKWPDAEVDWNGTDPLL